MLLNVDKVGENVGTQCEERSHTCSSQACANGHGAFWLGPQQVLGVQMNTRVLLCGNFGWVEEY